MPRRRRYYRARPVIRWRTRYARPIRRYGRRARGIFGRRLTLKGLLTGTIGLWLVNRFNPFGGVYKPAVDKVATGAILQMAGMDNSDLVSAGIKEGAVMFVNSFVGGGVIGAVPSGQFIG